MKFPVVLSNHITSNLPNPTQSIISGYPNNEQLTQMHNKSCANFSYVLSNLRSDLKGILLIVVPHKDYLTQTVHELITLHKPGN